MTLTPAQNGAIKQFLILILLAVAGFVADAANVSPFLGTTAAAILSIVASSLESKIKADSGRGLFGAAKVR